MQNNTIVNCIGLLSSFSITQILPLLEKKIFEQNFQHYILTTKQFADNVSEG